jgi:hypothetical protein
VPPGAVQRADQQRPQALSERLIREQPAQLGHELSVQAAAHVRIDPQLERGHPGLLEPVGLGHHQSGRRHIGQRLAPPQPERLRQGLGGATGVALGQGLPALPGQGPETLRVQLAGVQQELVSGGTSGQNPAFGVAENTAQPQHVHAHQVRGPVRRVIAPQLGDQAVG